jgi:hypothetical protein
MLVFVVVFVVVTSKRPKVMTGWLEGRDCGYLRPKNKGSILIGS